MEVIPDLVEIGVTALSTVQLEAIDPFEVKQRWGDRLAQGGTIGLQSTLCGETLSGVRRTVGEHIRRLGVKGGFFGGPCQRLRARCALENNEAMYAAVVEYGRSVGC